jgi:hypothetical protein
VLWQSGGSITDGHQILTGLRLSLLFCRLQPLVTTARPSSTQPAKGPPCLARFSRLKKQEEEYLDLLVASLGPVAEMNWLMASAQQPSPHRAGGGRNKQNNNDKPRQASWGACVRDLQGFLNEDWWLCCW